MSNSLLLDVPKEILQYIFIHLDLVHLVKIKKIFPFTKIQGECDRIIQRNLDITRNIYDRFSKNYIKTTLYYLAKDLAMEVDLPDPYDVNKVFFDRDKEIKSLIPKIDYSDNIETILNDRLKYDKKFNLLYEPILRFYEENKCNTFPTHPIVISFVLDKLSKGIDY